MKRRETNHPLKERETNHPLKHRLPSPRPPGPYWVYSFLGLTVIKLKSSRFATITACEGEEQSDAPGQSARRSAQKAPPSTG